MTDLLAAVMLTTDKRGPCKRTTRGITYGLFKHWPSSARAACRLSRKVRSHARVADKHGDDIDGALVSEDMIGLVSRVHGPREELLWARSDETYEAEYRAVTQTVPLLYVWRGRRLVAMCAPLVGSALRPRPT